ncbi:MAG: PD40 domain-containing protein [Caldilineaceae bacterium]|nr:PD40 domain-containing protein [Caldilineaceae bacterium]
MSTTTKRPLQAEDLYQLQTLTECEISPDGQWVLFCVGRVDRKTEKKYSSLWLVNTDNGEMRQFTTGEQNDNHARWSPDGRTIVFLSNRADEKQPQLYLINFAGGEARKLTALKGNFGSFAWSPDGTRIAYQFRKTDAEVLEREADEHKKELGVVARRVTRTMYKFDGAGLLPEARWQLWVIDAQSGATTTLTANERVAQGPPAWSPDGRLLVYTANRHDDPQLHIGQEDLFVVSVQDGVERLLATPVGRKRLPSFSPDGQWISYFGAEGLADPFPPTNLWILPSSGEGAAHNLSADHDRDCEPTIMGDSSGSTPQRPLWSADGAQLYVPVSRHGQGELHAVATDGSALAPIIATKGWWATTVGTKASANWPIATAPLPIPVKSGSTMRPRRADGN